MTPGEQRLLQQRIDELYGTRRTGGTLSQSAIRALDLQSLLQIPDELASSQATASPTQAEYNDLQNDVQMLHTRLRGVVAALRTRLGR